MEKEKEKKVEVKKEEEMREEIFQLVVVGRNLAEKVEVK